VRFLLAFLGTIVGLVRIPFVPNQLFAACPTDNLLPRINGVVPSVFMRWNHYQIPDGVVGSVAVLVVNIVSCRDFLPAVMPSPDIPVKVVFPPRTLQEMISSEREIPRRSRVPTLFGIAIPFDAVNYSSCHGSKSSVKTITHSRVLTRCCLVRRILAFLLPHRRLRIAGFEFPEGV
jgi:hypothetical protein